MKGLWLAGYKILQHLNDYLLQASVLCAGFAPLSSCEFGVVGQPLVK